MGKSRITLETEVLKIVTLLAVAIGGGSISLLLGEKTYLKVVLAALGGVITMSFVGFVWSQYRWLQREADKEDAK